MNFTKETMPWKVVIRSPDGKIKLTYYRSDTESLSVDETKLIVEIYDRENLPILPKQPSLFNR